jgi:2-keto-4-pentenoate hydratase
MIDQSTHNIQQAVEKLWEARETGIPCSPVRELIGENDIDLAYEVQELFNQRVFEEKGYTRSGFKIGLTSTAVQQQLGVDQPDFGLIFHQTDISKSCSVAFEELMQPKVEAEMAFVLGCDVTETFNHVEEVKQVLDCVCLSMEIVGSRVLNWDIRITDTVADNASASHYILSEHAVQVDDIDFDGATMKLYENGELKSQGNASACMGNPLNAVLWLCNTFIARGVHLKKGDVILSGALGPMVPCVPSAEYRAEIQGLGELSFRIK